MACTTPSGLIDCQLGNDRATRFFSKKIKVFNDYHKGTAENQAFTLSYDQFKTFLEIFLNANPGNNYSGIRVYFANYLNSPSDPGSVLIPHGDDKKLVLIFVPTIYNVAMDWQDDDPDMYWALINGVGEPLPNPGTIGDPTMDTASNWVRQYQKQLIPLLVTDGQPGHPGFQETMRMRYPWKIFFGGDPKAPSDTGLYGFMQCMHDTPPDPGSMVDGVNIRFAAYTENDKPAYQMTLVFDLHQVEDGPLAGSDMVLGKCPPIHILPNDTGFPCPPDTGCTKGLSLPAS